MTCEQYRLLLHDLLDGSLPDQTAQTMAAHEAECPACAAYRADLYALMQTLHTLDEDLEPPSSFGQAWRRAIRLEAAGKRRRPARMWQTWAAAAAALVCLVGGTSLMRAGILPGLSARTTQYDAYDEGFTPLAGNGSLYAKYDDSPEMESGSMGSQLRSFSADADPSPVIAEDTEGAPGASDEEAVLRGGVKILRSGYFHLATAAFDKDLEAILALVEETGGWVEYQSVNGEPIAQNPDGGRYGSLTLRIPAAELDRFVTDLTAIGHVQNSELSAQDISDQYRDQSARLTQYKAQRDRLEQLLRSAESVADIIEIEERLTEVQYQIDTLTGMLQGWDSRAQYAQVVVSLTETTENAQVLSADPSLGTRIRAGLTRSLQVFGAFLKDMAVFVVVLAPWLLVLAALAGAAAAVVRLIRRRNTREE